MDLSDVPAGTVNEIMRRLPDMLHGVNDEILHDAVNRSDLTTVARRLGELKAQEGRGSREISRITTAMKYIVGTI